MKLTIDETTYTQLQNLSYEPEADVTGLTLPIESFECDVYTGDSIPYGKFALLQDNMNGIWANYWIDYAQRVNEQCVHVRAKSPLELLERVILPERMYTGADIDDVMDDIFNSLGAGYTVGIDYEVQAALSSLTISGFCPEQSARERLQWVCLAVGAYVRTCFTDKVLIEAVPTRAPSATVPFGETFWRPEVSAGEYITKFAVRSYDFTEGAASQVEILSDDLSYKFPLPWIAEETTAQISPTVPAGAPSNEIEVEDVYLISQDAMDEVLSRLSRTMASRVNVRLDAINNRQYYPGQFIRAYTDDSTVVVGYITRESFRFGVQARATMEIVGAETVPSAALTILYKYGDTTLRKAKYELPVGVAFEIANPYIDKTKNGTRRVYRPLTAAATGTMVEGGMSVTVSYEIALELSDGILSVLSVDSLTMIEGTVDIG